MIEQTRQYVLWLWRRISYHVRYYVRYAYEWLQKTRHSLSRTLLTKYLLVTSAILIIAFITFGIILAGITSNRWQGERQQMLSDNVGGIAERAGSYIVATVNDDGEGTGDFRFSAAASSSLRSSMSVIGQSLGADFFLVDAQNNVLLCAEEDGQGQNPINPDGTPKCKHRDMLPPDFFTQMINEASRSKTNDCRTTGTLDGIYDEEQYIVGVPIIAKDAEGSDVIVGVAVAVSSAGSVKRFRSDITNMVLIAILIGSLVSFTAVYFITYQQVKPLRDMAAAVGRFASGDFSVRVPVTDETEVGQLAGAFNNMAKSLDSSEMMRRSFIANVSHELKTPMTTISGFVDGILDGTIPQERHDQYLTVVSSETKRLSRLVRSMLDLSRIDSGDIKLNISRFDMSKTVTDTLLTFVQRIEDKNIDIRGMDNLRPIYVNGDSDLIHQVVYNLIENAVKFTNTDGYISVKVFTRENNVHVRIRNSGMGIPANELSHVFERFYKTDKSRSSDKTGVGLGLFIVKTIIGLHNGSIDVRSKEGSWCEFEFRLPLSAKG